MAITVIEWIYFIITGILGSNDDNTNSPTLKIDTPNYSEEPPLDTEHNLMSSRVLKEIKNQHNAKGGDMFKQFDNHLKVNGKENELNNTVLNSSFYVDVSPKIPIKVKPPFDTDEPKNDESEKSIEEKQEISEPDKTISLL